MGANRVQQKAIDHFEGPCLVLAGPGSGKTYTISRRIQALIEKHKVRPEEILVITFTKAASIEMQQRFQSLMNGRYVPVTFGTFHGVFFRILKWAYKFDANNIFREEEKYQLIKELLYSEELGYDMDGSDEKEEIQDVIGEISNVKNRGISVETYQSERFGVFFHRIYRAYERKRKELRKIDFDDMLLLCYQLFQNNAQALELWQRRFRYILVDEFQDTNRVQYEVLKMLAAPENNLFVVGDDDQSIYRFRGASPNIMLEFREDYPDTTQILLDTNYRSTQRIVNGSMRVIANNRNRYEKKIFANTSGGRPIHVQETRDPKDEGEYICGRILSLKKEGISYDQMAILYRSAVDARVMIEELIEHQIPFFTKEPFKNIYDHFIAKNVINYLKMASGERKREQFLDIMNVPKRYISRDALERKECSLEDLRKFYFDKDWMQDRIDQFEWDLKMMKNQTPFAAIQYLRKSIGYEEYLREYSKIKNVNQEDLFEVLDEIQEKAKDFSKIEDWLQFVVEYSDTMRRKAKEKTNTGENVSLISMHGSKGLEFDTVFILTANEGIAPYKKAQLDEEIEEERRMFYVAMTRAKRELNISYVKEKNGKTIQPSRFVDELILV